MRDKQNYDAIELAKFSKLAAQWWDEAGELKTLHQINPLRMRFIEEKVKLSGLKAIDVGCGGGILSESLAMSGAITTGIDLSAEAIEVAKLHQYESGTNVDYLLVSAETLAAEKAAQFDIVTCMEMIEHVPDPNSIIEACATLCKPGGHVFFSTLNRNLKSYVSAIIGAEYVLKILPKGTHDYAKFIKPSELAAWARTSHIHLEDMMGIRYQPFSKTFSLSKNVDVNYLFYGRKAL